MAVAPAVVLLSYFYIRDLYESEPLRVVLFSFFLGMLSVFPVLWLQTSAGQWVAHPIAHVVLVAAGVEEVVKFLILLGFMQHSPDVNEIYDGILYAAAISLGFATVENIASVIPGSFETAAIRAFLPVPGHALFGVIMGYYAARAKFERGRSKTVTWAKALLYAWLLHAAYDLILASHHYIWGIGILPFMAGLWVIGLRKMRTAQERSPFKPKY
jgi:RsiW-degrading membrane proteinase PrsW (M82 family)